MKDRIDLTMIEIALISLCLVGWMGCVYLERIATKLDVLIEQQRPNAAKESE